MSRDGTGSFRPDEQTLNLSYGAFLDGLEEPNAGDESTSAEAGADLDLHRGRQAVDLHEVGLALHEVHNVIPPLQTTSAT